MSAGGGAEKREVDGRVVAKQLLKVVLSVFLGGHEGHAFSPPWSHAASSRSSIQNTRRRWIAQHLHSALVLPGYTWGQFSMQDRAKDWRSEPWSLGFLLHVQTGSEQSLMNLNIQHPNSVLAHLHEFDLGDWGIWMVAVKSLESHTQADGY